MCSYIAELSYENVVVFPEGWYSRSFNMQETIFNVLLEECFAFIQYVKIMCYGREYDVHVLYILHYQICRSCTAQLAELVGAISNSKAIY